MYFKCLYYVYSVTVFYYAHYHFKLVIVESRNQFNPIPGKGGVNQPPLLYSHAPCIQKLSELSGLRICKEIDFVIYGARAPGVPS